MSYIERETALNLISDIFFATDPNGEEQCGVIKCSKAIRNAPAANVVEVVHGEWIAHGYKWRCSVCNHRLNLDGTPTENGFYFCPNCGAKMDRKGD